MFGIIAELKLINEVQTSLTDKIKSLVGATFGASYALSTIQMEVYNWFKTIILMVIGTFLTYFMPKVWKYLHDKFKHRKKRKHKSG